jgi:hypothetical protein
VKNSWIEREQRTVDIEDEMQEHLTLQFSLIDDREAASIMNISSERK